MSCVYIFVLTVLGPAGELLLWEPRARPALCGGRSQGPPRRRPLLPTEAKHSALDSVLLLSFFVCSQPSPPSHRPQMCQRNGQTITGAQRSWYFLFMFLRLALCPCKATPPKGCIGGPGAGHHPRGQTQRRGNGGPVLRKVYHSLDPPGSWHQDLEASGVPWQEGPSVQLT